MWPFWSGQRCGLLLTADSTSTPQNMSRMKVVALCTMSGRFTALVCTKKEGTASQRSTTPRGSRPAATVETWLPNHPKRERSLFHSTKLFFFALLVDQFRINSGGVECDLRASKDGSIKVIGEVLLLYTWTLLVRTGSCSS